MSLPQAQIVELPLDSVEANPFNVRDAIGPGDLAGLAASIATQGLLHPITVRPHPDPERFGQYQIVCGERRYHAFRLLAEHEPARWDAIPARVRNDLDEAGMLAAMLQENELRSDWSAWERAAFFRAAYESGRFPSIRRMADAVGVGLTTLHRYLRIFDLPARWIEAFRRGEVGLAQVEVLLEADPAIRDELGSLLIARRPNKAEARALARELANQDAARDWISKLQVTPPAEGLTLRRTAQGLRLELTAEAPEALRDALTKLLHALD